jgi:hypothetical protein
MTTVQQIVDGAAEELGVKTAEINLEAGDFQAILTRMNDLGSEWADIGLLPAFVPVLNSTDTVNIDRNSDSALKLNLAIRCASAFQKRVSQELSSSALDALNRLRASQANIQVVLPDTLPTGSGNDCGTFSHDRFFDTNKTENF